MWLTTAVTFVTDEKIFHKYSGCVVFVMLSVPILYEIYLHFRFRII